MSLKVFVIPVLLALFSQVISQNVIYISPSAESPCPVSACFTLVECAQNVTMCFVSNTTLRLLQGTHTLETIVMVRDVTNLVLIGDSSSLPKITTEIRFNRAAGFHLAIVTDVQICAISFSNSKLFISGARIFRISDCIFQHSRQTALSAVNTTAYFERVSFTTNHERGMEAYGSTLIFRGKNIFANNSAGTTGGGLSVHKCDVAFTGWSSFTNNSAGNGGGIYSANSSLTFTANIIFTHNTAHTFGGGFSAFHSIVKFTSNTTFLHNSATYGGGISSVHSGLTVSGTSTFALNKAVSFGGAFAIFSGMFTQNTDTLRGSISSTCDLTARFYGESKFVENSAGANGGTCSVHSHSSLIFNGSNLFLNNSAVRFGGAFDIDSSTVMLVGTTSLTHNFAGNYGGGLWVQNGSGTFLGNSAFTGNSAKNGGAIGALTSNLSLHGNNSFTNNFALHYGGGVFVIKGKIVSSNSCIYTNNVAKITGGGLYIQNSSGIFNGDNAYIRNSAGVRGGGVAVQDGSILEFNGVNTFVNNHAGYFGGGFNAGDSQIGFTGTSSFTSNLSGRGGGAAYPVGSFLTFTGSSIFKENFAQVYGGAIFSICQPFGTIRNAVKFNGTVEFTENIAGNGGGALALWNYTAVFIGRCAFRHNTAKSGGALIGSTSMCYFFPNSSVNFEDNYAFQRGGAINHLDDPFYNCFLLSTLFEKTKLLIPCFYQIPLKSGPPVELVFTNNTAGEAGDSLYGGAIDHCLTYSIEGAEIGYDMFDLLSTITGNSTTSSVSSDPFRVCPCINNQPDCSSLSIKRETYPGATFLISAVGVGQRNGTVPAVVRAELGMTSQAKIDNFQKVQEIAQHCSILHYTIYPHATLEEVHLELYAEGLCPRLGDPLKAFVKLLKCPAGFAMSESKNSCLCEERLLEYTSSCNITDATIEHSGNFWVGYSNSSSGLILHPHCPFDYCTTETIRFTLEDSDKQCRYNRTRLLCGACKPGLSIALATSECMVCSNSHLSLLLAFALAGIVLVVFLFVCKLTVSVGTLNGLILYTNIVAVNKSIFVPNGRTNILTVFVAWMNLDIGIKTCLYDGMDAYGRTWLQFLFPVYIWTLVGLIIIASYYSTKIARILTGTNPVSVLATLFLLSYAKMLRTVITVLSFTSLEYPNNSRVTVWLFDGNIEYFHGKHIPLAIVVLIVFLILLLPFTLLLMFGQWIQANSRRRVFSWVSDPRVTAVMDAYHAPFNRYTRYWIGLLLLLRCALSLVFACNVLGDPSLNLLAISASMLGLEAVMKFTGVLYKNRYLDILESSFILNLGILAIGTYQVEQGGGSQMALYCTSVGVAFATFIGIALYHVILQLKGSRIWNALQYYFKRERRWVTIPTEDTTEESVHNPGVAPTVSYIKLREPLELIN